MKKFNSARVSIAAISAIIAVLSCSSDIELPPGSYEEDGSSSSVVHGVSSSDAVSSSSTVPSGESSSSVEQGVSSGETASSSSDVASSSSTDIGEPSSSSSVTLSSSSTGGNSSESQEIGQCENGEFTDPRDSKKYKCETDPSNNRIWMSENLNYSRGNTLGWCYNQTERTSLGTVGADLPSCGGGYGRLYTWEIAMDGNSQRGLCPKGWHIPSVAEWTALGAGNQSSQVGTRRMSNAFYIYSGSYDVAGWEGRIPGWWDRDKNGFYWTNNNKNNYVLMGTDNSRNYFYSQSTATATEYYSIRCIFDNPASGSSSSSSSIAQSSSSVVPSSSSIVPSSSSQGSGGSYDYEMKATDTPIIIPKAHMPIVIQMDLPSDWKTSGTTASFTCSSNDGGQISGIVGTGTAAVSLSDPYGSATVQIPLAWTIDKYPLVVNLTGGNSYRCQVYW